MENKTLLWDNLTALHISIPFFAFIQKSGDQQLKTFIVFYTLCNTQIVISSNQTMAQLLFGISLYIEPSGINR